MTKLNKDKNETKWTVELVSQYIDFLRESLIDIEADATGDFPVFKVEGPTIMPDGTKLVLEVSYDPDSCYWKVSDCGSTLHKAIGTKKDHYKFDCFKRAACLTRSVSTNDGEIYYDLICKQDVPNYIAIVADGCRQILADFKEGK